MTELTRKFKRPISPLKVLKPSINTQISQNLLLNRAIDKQWKGSKMELEELQNIRDNYVTQQNMESKFQQSNDETVILQTLKCKIEEILQKDSEDPLFGRTEDDPHPVIQRQSDIIVQDLTVDKEIQQNMQFLISNDKLDTCNDVEMMNVAFDGILQQLTTIQQSHQLPQMPSIIDTLNQLKVYYINKIFHKSAMEKAAAEATKVLDGKCQRLIHENDVLQQQLTQIKQQNELLTKDNATLRDKLKQQIELYQNTHQQAINYQKMVRDYLEKLERMQTAYDRSSVIVEQFKHRSKMATDSMLKAKMHLKNVMADKIEIQQLNENLKIEKLNFKVQIDGLNKQIVEDEKQMEALNEEINALNKKIIELSTKDPEDIRSKTLGEVFGGGPELGAGSGSYLKQAISALIKLSSAEFQDQLTTLLNVTKEELSTHKLVMEKIYYANNLEELMNIANINGGAKRGKPVNQEVQVDDVAYKHLLKEYNKISVQLQDSQRSYEDVRRQLQSMASYDGNQLKSGRGSDNASPNRFSIFQTNPINFSLCGMYYTSNINVLSDIFGNINNGIDTTFLQKNLQDNQHVAEAIEAYQELESELKDMPDEIRRDMRLTAASSLFNKNMPKLIKNTLGAPIPIDKKIRMKRLAKELEITRQQEEDKRTIDQISAIINEIIERSKAEKIQEKQRTKFIESEKTTHMIINRDVKRADPSDNYLEFVASGKSSIIQSRNDLKRDSCSSPIRNSSGNFSIEELETVDKKKNKENVLEKTPCKPPSGKARSPKPKKSPVPKTKKSFVEDKDQKDNNQQEEKKKPLSKEEQKRQQKEEKRQQNIQKLVQLIESKMDTVTVKKFIKQLENRSGDWDVIFSDSVSLTTGEFTDQDEEIYSEGNVDENGNITDIKNKNKHKLVPVDKDDKQAQNKNDNEISITEEEESQHPLQKRNTMRLRKSTVGLSGTLDLNKTKDQSIYQLTAISYVERQTDQQLLEEELTRVQDLLNKDNEEALLLNQNGGYRQFNNRGMMTDLNMGLVDAEVQTDETNDGVDQAAVTAEILKIFQDDADGQNIEDFDPRQFGEDGETDFKMQMRQNVDIKGVLQKESSAAHQRYQERNLKVLSFDRQHQNNLMLQQLKEKFKNQEKTGKDVPMGSVLQEGMPQQILIRNQNVFKLKKVVTEVKPNFINFHPRFGNVMKVDYSFQIPQIQQFVLVHFKDNLILKYYPDNFDNISSFCPCVVKTFNLKQYKELHNNTKSQFQSLYNDPNYKMSSDQSLLPFIEQKIQLIRLSSLMLTGKPGTQPLFFKLVAKTFGYQMKLMSFNNQQYIQIPFHNITLRSLNWTVRLVRQIINSRVEQTCSFIKLLMENQSDLNVIQTFNYEIFQNTLEKQNYDNLAGFTVNWIQTKYGQPNICLQLVYSLLANISYYQYENSEIYLFTRMLIGDVDDDYFLLYCDMRKCLGLYGLEIEYIHVDVINQLVMSIFQNWPVTRLKVFCEQIYAMLYSKVSTNQPLGCVIEFIELAQLMLFSYGVYRTQVYKEFLTVYRYMVREQQMNGLKLEREGLTEGSFKQFFNALLPQWPDSSIYEFFYHHKQLIRREATQNANQQETKQENRIEQVVVFSDIQNIFVSTQLGRFVEVSTTLLNQLIDLECKKMTKRLSVMFQQTQPIISQVTMYLTMQKNRQTLQLGAAAKTKIEQRFMSVMEKIKTINKQIQQDIFVYDVVNGILNFGKLITIFLSELVDMRQNLCLVIIGGALNSLGQFLRVIDAAGAKQVAEMQAEAKKSQPLNTEESKTEARQEEEKQEDMKKEDLTTDKNQQEGTIA